jgi:hypothetical protein
MGGTVYIQISGYNTPDGVHWRMCQVRPSRDMRAHGLYVWERSGDIHVDPAPVTSRALVQAIIDELQRALGER